MCVQGHHLSKPPGVDIAHQQALGLKYGRLDSLLSRLHADLGKRQNLDAFCTQSEEAKYAMKAKAC